MPTPQRSEPGDKPVVANPVFGAEPITVPRFELPQSGIDPDVAYQIVHDELMLDGNARLNLATFVTTWEEPAARRLMSESFDKNMIDKDEYPRTADLEQRCVRMLADLWNAPDPARAVGCSTTGPARPACSAGWRSSGAGRAAAARRARTPPGPTS
jgi:glutamate decarboxylase